jgi:hypothetical protein
MDSAGGWRDPMRCDGIEVRPDVPRLWCAAARNSRSIAFASCASQRPAMSMVTRQGFSVQLIEVGSALFRSRLLLPFQEDGPPEWSIVDERLYNSAKGKDLSPSVSARNRLRFPEFWSR